ncbi:MAG: glutathione S-transferase family protein, partial [Gammaproteobacteria bacterium]
TQLIATVLEREYPTPSIFPDGNPGLGLALGSWAHGPYVVTSVAIYMGSEDPFAGAVNLPSHFFEDRKKMWKTQFDTDSLAPKLPLLRSQLDAHTAFINQQLADGRPFLTGSKPGLVDLHAMWDPWFLYRFAPKEAARAYDRFPQIAEWLARLAAIGQGTRTEMAPDDALEIARTATPKPALGVDRNDPISIAAGSRVAVSADDYAEVDVIGELVGTAVDCVSVRRSDPQVGDVIVHFPKIGYRIQAL